MFIFLTFITSNKFVVIVILLVVVYIMEHYIALLSWYIYVQNKVYSLSFELQDSFSLL